MASKFHRQPWDFHPRRGREVSENDCDTLGQTPENDKSGAESPHNYTAISGGRS